MQLRKYTEEQLKDAILTSLSIRQALTKLNVAAAGGNYEVFKKAVAYFDIDTSHFLGQKTNSGIRHKGGSVAFTLENICVENSTYASTYNLKKKLLSQGVMKPICVGCGLDTWISLLSCDMEVPIPLELDHINGIRSDNRLTNLRLLCPNCHALTSTYRGKNKK